LTNNPFASVIKNIKEENKLPVIYRIGTVVSAEPLIVEVAGINQEADALLKNDALKSFAIGDSLLLIPIEDEQRYIIICKVVPA